MKNFILAAIIAVVASSTLSSCKKDYECTCKYDDGSKVSVDYGKTKKQAATDACRASSAIAAGNGGSCELN